jgi:hypothetical protein
VRAPQPVSAPFTDAARHVFGLLLVFAIGVLIPAIAVRISSTAEARQGWGMGRQAAAANLGRSLGSFFADGAYMLSTALRFMTGAVLLPAGGRMTILERDSSGEA